MSREDFVAAKIYKNTISRKKYVYVGPHPTNLKLGFFFDDDENKAHAIMYDYMKLPTKSGKVWVTILEDDFDNIWPIASNNARSPSSSGIKILTQFQVDWEEKVS